MESEALNVRDLTAYPLSGRPVEGQFPGLSCMRYRSVLSPLSLLFVDILRMVTVIIPR
jgi:hypothetical protein